MRGYLPGIMTMADKLNRGSTLTQPTAIKIIAPVAVACFVVGIVPLLGLALFSPGISSNGVLGYSIFAFGLITLGLLIAAARYNRLRYPDCHLYQCFRQ